MPHRTKPPGFKKIKSDSSKVCPVVRRRKSIFVSMKGINTILGDIVTPLGVE
jgi:hypothetical protein